MAYEPPADLPVAAPKSQSLIVEPSALASIPTPPIKDKPDIPDSIPQKGVLQAHQYQTVCQAVNAHNTTLPDGRRRGYFCGDGTGAGKTRIIAGVMLDAVNRNLGKGKALIISKNKELYEAGLYVNPVLPPACAPGECLLRTSYMATHTEALIDEAVEIAARVLLGD
jgi:hypothetical protein